VLCAVSPAASARCADVVIDEAFGHGCLATSALVTARVRAQPAFYKAQV